MKPPPKAISACKRNDKPEESRMRLLSSSPKEREGKSGFSCSELFEPTIVSMSSPGAHPSSARPNRQAGFASPATIVVAAARVRPENYYWLLEIGHSSLHVRFPFRAKNSWCCRCYHYGSRRASERAKEGSSSGLWLLSAPTRPTIVSLSAAGVSLMIAKAGSRLPFWRLSPTNFRRHLSKAPRVSRSGHHRHRQPHVSVRVGRD